jgi:hypothetical protein
MDSNFDFDIIFFGIYFEAKANCISEIKITDKFNPIE